MENLHVVKIHILLCNAVALLSTSVGFLCSSQVMFGNKSKSNWCAADAPAVLHLLLQIVHGASELLSSKVMCKKWSIKNYNILS